MVYCIWFIYPCEYIVYTRCSKTYFFFEGAMNKPQYPSQFFLSSMSLFDTLVLKKSMAVSKSGMDLFKINTNFSTTQWNNSPLLSLNFLHLTSLRTIGFLQEMWPTYWSPHQTFICTPPTVWPCWLVLFCPLPIYSPPRRYACSLSQQIALQNVSSLRLWYLISPLNFYAITCCHPHIKIWYIFSPITFFATYLS